MRTFKNALKTLTLSALALLSLSVHAAIVDLGSITRDTATGLDWLDLTATRNRSYLDIAAQLGSGGEFAGWRFATSAEAQAIEMELGVYQRILHSDSVGMARFAYATALFGDTFHQSDSFETGFRGITSDVPGTWCSNCHYIMGLLNDERNPSVGYYPYLSGAIADSLVSPYDGSFLVRPSAVPITDTAWLFGSSLVGLTGLARKRNAT